MAAATTGGVFGGVSTGFSFGSGTSTKSFGAPNLGASVSGTGTLGTTGFSAIKQFGVATTTPTVGIPFGQPATATTGTNSALQFGGLGSTTSTSFPGLIAPKTTSSIPTLGVLAQTSQAGQSSGFTLGGTPGTSAPTGLTLGGGLFKTNAATTASTLLGSTLTPNTGLGSATSSGLGAFGSLGATKSTSAVSATGSTALTGLGGTGSSTGGATTGTVSGMPGRQG